jgi:hypothetical protein
MLPLRFSLGAFALLAFGAGAACSSSSSSNNASDAGTGDGSTSTAPDATLPINATCGLLASLGGGTSMMCPAGQTCCSMIGLTGGNASCVPVGSCASGSISNECSKGSDCASGQVCCGGSPDAGALGTGLDAAVAGGMPMFDPSQLDTTCQASCTATQTQQCAMDSECPSGQTCVSLGGGAGDAGDAAAANPFGGLFMLPPLPSLCMAPRPDAGPPPVVDAGTTEDTGTPTPEASDMADVATGD